MKKLVVFFLTVFLSAGAASAQEENKTRETVYTIVEKMPEFAGGEPALAKFLQNNIIYAKAARDKGIEGKVYVNFLIDRKGNVKNVKLIRGIDPLLDNEALRVIKMMPRWKPGTQGGRKVSVSFNLPIEFKLD